LFDEWYKSRAGEPLEQKLVSFGTVDWLFREYKKSNAYTAKVALRSRPDYERTMSFVTGLVTKKGDRVGDRKIRAITPLSADRIYQLILEGKPNTSLATPAEGEETRPNRDRRFGPRGRRPRQAEKAVKLCARAWDVVHRLYPDLFDPEVPNPWRGVAFTRRTKRVKPAATREQVYLFAETAIVAGYPEVGAAAVICFEWLQRPENVVAGYIRWTDEAPTAIRIIHHKTGAVVLHPLEDADGTQFYADAEAVLVQVPRRGLPIVMRDTRGNVEQGRAKPAKLYSAGGMEKLVRRLRERAKLPRTFTLDACRHGGMTELEEAELTVVRDGRFPRTPPRPTRATRSGL
jgi:hypothetical protein